MKENEVCQVHKTKLIKMKVPISYGMPDFDESFKVSDKLFPNSYRYVLGGCLVDESFPRFSSEMVCRECRKAEAAWKKENKNKIST
jgi:hypothetical protein